MSERDPQEIDVARAAWSQLRAVERLTVTVVVDNETDGLSAPCACCDPSLDPNTSTPYQSELTWATHQVASGKWPDLDFRQSLLAGHGLSLLLSATTSDGSVHRLLFDGGPREDLWSINAERLGVDMAGVGAAVLSHWHVDHSVGLLAAARAASAARVANQGRPEAELPPGPEPVQEPFVLDLHPARPARRGLLLGPSQKPVPFNVDPTLEQLSLPGCRVDLHASPHTLLGNRFFVSGSIPRIVSFETGQPGHATLGADGNWHLDPYIMEERYLAVRVRGRGVVVFSGCSHAGIINVVQNVKEVSGEHVFGVVGGLHLAGSKMEGRIPETVAALKEIDPDRVFGGHCTGWRAKAALVAAFPDRFQPLSVGGTYTFLAAPLGEAQKAEALVEGQSPDGEALP
ncbi:hypothetical protein Vretimale_7908 [Volvox reticuliferus]|uniref:Metallo-beta-lactamase domain-containing protein n=2 Tax=Volvox reticuliferus TaxID=1737510 RepID=A0A8J4LNP7_9CHLO|nr:hypothetical protein Vretifemale_5028 [Volvox reticuliferus]GIM03120.1 hypothetical protein Vretimale_7908 [Volvox reticuliferus]